MTVAYCGADMTKPAEIEHMIETANRELGKVDIVFNNAGIQHVAPSTNSRSTAGMR